MQYQNNELYSIQAWGEARLQAPGGGAFAHDFQLGAAQTGNMKTTFL